MGTVLTALGDVGGQKTLRSYWKNYFEKTDTLVWVVDATDRLRVDDCRQELSGLLLEEVRMTSPPAIRKFWNRQLNPFHQRLTGASLLVFLNKTDVEHCMSEQEVREVGLSSSFGVRWGRLPDLADVSAASWLRFNQNTQVDYLAMQCNDGQESEWRSRMGGTRCQGPTVPLLVNSGEISLCLLLISIAYKISNMLSYLIKFQINLFI